MKTNIKSTLWLVMLLNLTVLTAHAVPPTPRVRTTFDSQAYLETSMRRPLTEQRSFKVKLSTPTLARPGIRGDLSMRVGRSGLSLGALGEYMEFTASNTRFSVVGGGVNANYYFKGSPFVDSWYVSPAAVYRSGRIEVNSIPLPGVYYGLSDMRFSANFDLYSLETLIGYQWHWTGFNVSLGAGPAYHHLTVKDIRGYFRGGFMGASDSDFSASQTTSSSFGGAVAELALGWSF